VNKESFLRIFFALSIFLISTSLIFFLWFIGYFSIAREYTLKTLEETYIFFKTHKIEQGTICMKKGARFGYQNYSKSLCCSGLKPIKTMAYYTEGQESYGGCSISLSSGYVCSNCGDGFCNPLENYCNCPEDCTKEESINKTYQFETLSHP